LGVRITVTGSARWVPTAATAAALVVLLFGTGPAAAQAPAASGSAIEVQRLRPGLHLLTGAGSNVVAWSGQDGTVLVDGGNAATAPQVIEAVAGLGRAGGLRFVVNTHWHPDHSGANEALARAGAVVIAHENSRARMAEPQEIREYETRMPAAPRGALAVATFADGMTLNLNGGRLALLHVPEAHTDGDAVAWWPEANVVHLGDLYYAGGYPFVDTEHGGSLAGLVAALETVLSRANAATVVVPGHGPVGTRADLVAYRNMLVAVGKRVRELAEQGQSLDEVVAARPAADWDERYGSGGVGAERFVRILYEDLAARR
jgi:glyoxylase-like metal-dependent hydrolase (beta-lactamase superfamily II)